MGVTSSETDSAVPSAFPNEGTRLSRHDGQPGQAGKTGMHPLLIILSMVMIAALLTFAVPAGRYARDNGRVLPTSFHYVPQMTVGKALVASTLPSDRDEVAQPTGIVALFSVLPAGMIKSAPLFFMVMFVGGTFGILRTTGAIDAGMDRFLQITSGNVYLLASGLVVILACGSTFVGFSSEYVALIPIVGALGQRLGLPKLFAVAVIALADFIGYGISVTNPIVLGVAQPVAGVPIFSGALLRLALFIVMLMIGMMYLIAYLRRQPCLEHIPETSHLSLRQTCVLATLITGAAGLIAGTALWSWETPQLAAAFLALSVALSLAGGVRAAAAADAFLHGMAVMLLPCLLIGLAAAIGIMLQSSQVLDTIVNWIGSSIQSDYRGVVAIGLMIAEMGFGVLIPSASAKAAVSLPILTPIAHLSGLSGQTAVTALLLGSAMTNFISPNPLLLAFLAAGRVGYLEWLRFVFPLFVCFTAISFAVIFFMAATGM